MSLEADAKLQAAFLNVLRAKAIDVVDETPAEELALDPQGRVLVNVDRNALDFDALRQTLSSEGVAFSSTDELKAAVATFSNTDNITVSVDAVSSPKVNQLLRSELPEGVADQYLEIDRGSVIPLQQELSFHLAGAKRVLTEKVLADSFRGKQAEVDAAYQAADLEVNTLVKQTFRHALSEAVDKDGHVDVAKLNVKLDKARATIAPQAHQIFVTKLAEHTGVNLRAQTFGKAQAKRLKSELKHEAESTTATSNDILVLDGQQKLATLIRGTEETAHNRRFTSGGPGPSFAHRQIITQPLSHTGVRATTAPRVQIRTPSPVVKKIEAHKKSSDVEIIEDVSKKFAEIKRDYQLEGKVQAKAGLKAFYYDRHTAINDGNEAGPFKKNKNLQSESAAHILQGVHQYNRVQLGTPNEVFAFVQNISVNGYGDSLGYGGNALKNESTLQAEIALLHSNSDVLTAESQHDVAQVISEYKDFLAKSADGDDNFYKSEQGGRAKALLQKIKSDIKASPISTNSTDIKMQAKAALVNLVASDKHQTHEFAKTIQALSIYSQEASIAGCKSGNERAEAINKRVSIFDSLAADPNARDMSDLKSALNEVATGGKEFDKLNIAVDETVNTKGLQSAAAAISQTDQLAPAKVQKKSGLITINRNKAESARLTNLSQSKASKLQAHKGFSKYLSSAILPPKKPSILTRVTDFFKKLVGKPTSSDKMRAFETQRDRASGLAENYQATHGDRTRRANRVALLNRVTPPRPVRSSGPVELRVTSSAQKAATIRAQSPVVLAGSREIQTRVQELGGQSRHRDHTQQVSQGAAERVSVVQEAQLRTREAANEVKSNPQQQAAPKGP